MNFIISAAFIAALALILGAVTSLRKGDADESGQGTSSAFACSGAGCGFTSCAGCSGSCGVPPKNKDAAEDQEIHS